MSVRVFNKRWTRKLEMDGESFVLRPNAFENVPEKFTGDITFKVGVKAGDIEVFETKAQGEKIEKAVYEGEAKPEKKPRAKKGEE